MQVLQFWLKIKVFYLVGIYFVAVRDAYEWLITWLVVETRKSFVEEMTKGASRLAANNKSQVYKASTLSKAYGEVSETYQIWV